MPEITLTPKIVSGLQATKRTVYWDTSPLAPPRFCVRVNGIRGVYYLVVGQAWVKIGDTRAISLEDARKAARIAYGKAASGEDPRPTKLTAAPDTVTVTDLLRHYIASRSKSLSPVTIGKYTYEAERIAETPFGRRKANSLVRKDVQDYLDSIPTLPMRDYVFRLLRAAFRWGVGEETRPGVFIVNRDPTRKIQELVAGTVRRTSLTDEEIKKVWLGVESLGIVKSTYVRLLMLLALRRGEAYKAVWPDIDIENRTWTIPTANRKIPAKLKPKVPDLVVPLPDLAVQLLSDLKKYTGSKRPFVLSVTDVAAQMKTASGVDKVYPHAFRKTISQRLEDAECPPHVVRLVLGRQIKEYESADLHYVAGRRPAEVRRWLEFWAAETIRIVGISVSGNETYRT